MEGLCALGLKAVGSGSDEGEETVVWPVRRRDSAQSERRVLWGRGFVVAVVWLICRR